ncbi:2511_t:CDS:2 [Paraglomus brasilianum]|uniref:2511_t:CDS:1 n=1 Tax=Paraglomus brasilianum TaxID=144538 RepID=A0A9N9ADL8_9GLOM|nr:2511_t:CDS:2 [Paraglomus brasilianum]
MSVSSGKPTSDEAHFNKDPTYWKAITFFKRKRPAGSLINLPYSEEYGIYESRIKQLWAMSCAITHNIPQTCNKQEERGITVLGVLTPCSRYSKVYQGLDKVGAHV